MDATLVNGTETFETEALIIGGGATGTGVMRDLALRGIHCLLIDRIDLNAGASGGNHGLLHSGGRYASADSETAAECREEGDGSHSLFSRVFWIAARSSRVRVSAALMSILRSPRYQCCHLSPRDARA